MKNTKILSLFLLLASTQMYSSSNPELALVFAYQTLDSLNMTISSENDDVAALKLLQVMNDSIAFDAAQKSALANAKNGYLFKGVPLDPVKIAAENKKLDDQADNIEDNLKAFKRSAGGITANEKKKVNRRRNDRDDLRRKIKENEAAIEANAAAQSEADKNAAAVKSNIKKNELTFEQALESYVSELGQSYSKAGSTVISSKYGKDIPITQKEYTQLVSTLNNAATQFGGGINITIDLIDSDKDLEATIKDVATFVGKVAPSTSYASYAAYGLAGLAATAAAIGTAAVAYNLYQGKNWNDTEDAAGVYNAGATGVSNAYGQAAGSQAGQYVAGTYNAAGQYIQNAYTAGMNAAGYQTGAQQEAGRQNTIDGINAARDAGARQIASEQAYAQQDADARNAAQEQQDAARDQQYNNISDASWDNYFN